MDKILEDLSKQDTCTVSNFVQEPPKKGDASLPLSGELSISVYIQNYIICLLHSPVATQKQCVCCF